MNQLPDTLRRYFWDVDPDALSESRHRDWIIGRLLAVGGRDAVRWLRATVGDQEIERWLREHEGGGLGARRLRFWALVLDLPDELVNAWVRAARQGDWPAQTAAS